MTTRISFHELFLPSSCTAEACISGLSTQSGGNNAVNAKYKMK